MNDNNVPSSKSGISSKNEPELLVTSQNSIVNTSEGTNDELDLMEIFFQLWQERWLIIIVTSIFAISSVLYAVSLNNKYRSEVLLQPVSDNSSSGGNLARLARNFGGLASLAGINLGGGGGGGTKTAMIIEVLKSRKFINNFIVKRNILIPLWAGNSIDEETGELIIDHNIYNEAEQQWVRDDENSKPTYHEAYRKFEENLYIFHNKQDSFVTIGYTHSSAEVAKEWVSYLVEDLNEYIRQQDLADAGVSIEYLKAELENTDVAELRKVINDLVKEQMNTIMLAKVRSEYALKIIDPPVAPELATSPKRKLIAVVGTLLGGILSLIIIFIRNSYRKKLLVWQTKITYQDSV